ncbi:Choline-sulfatase [hydrothermal vent metagenome]|uniref:Choline-sulfatase n=1 Tax=hydrothermal vent metagenome TaxID=652676 RepID=A0A3B1C154_9ZZZZ
MEGEISIDKEVSVKRSLLFGAGFFALWFFIDIAFSSGFAIMGESDKDIETFVRSNYLGMIVWYQLSLLFVAIIIGSVTGLLSAFFARYFGLGTRVAYGLTLLFFFASQLRMVVYQPQFFDGPFLDSHPLLSQIFFFPAGRLHPAIAEMFLWGVVAALLFAPVKNFFPWILERKSRAMAASIIALGVGLWNMGPAGIGAAQNERPNILLVVIDSLRPDHVSLNGYERKTTPNIDAIGRRGAALWNVISDLPRTYPSWVSMMTGRYPMTHGVRHMFPTLEQRRLIHPSLPETLSKAGWQTAVVSDFAGDIFPRIDFGFSSIDTPGFTFDDIVKIGSLETHPALLTFLNNGLGMYLYPVIRELVYNSDPGALTDKAIGQIESFRKGDPFFLSVFYSTTHLPYAAPAPYYYKFTHHEYYGIHKFQKKDLLMEKKSESPSDIQRVQDLYDGALFGIDKGVGRLIESLGANGYLENTIVIVTADHGENFFENEAEIGHGNHLRGPYAITVPLIIYDPRNKFALKQTNIQARLIDLAPTLVDLADVKAQPMTGESLRPVLDGEEQGDRVAYSESAVWYLNSGPFFFQKMRLEYPSLTELLEVDFDHDNEVVIKNKYQPVVVTAKHRMISDGEHKLIIMPTVDGIITELYDLVADPAELKDISKDFPEVTARLARLLYATVSQNTDAVIRDGYIYERREFVW